MKKGNVETEGRKDGRMKRRDGRKGMKGGRDLIRIRRVEREERVLNLHV